MRLRRFYAIMHLKVGEARMKQVNTNLTESQFSSNLKVSSRLKSRFDRINDAIRFIYEIKGNKFCLGKYDP